MARRKQYSSCKTCRTRILFKGGSRSGFTASQRIPQVSHQILQLVIGGHALGKYALHADTCLFCTTGSPRDHAIEWHTGRGSAYLRAGSSRMGECHTGRGYILSNAERGFGENPAVTNPPQTFPFLHDGIVDFHRIPPGAIGAMIKWPLIRSQRQAIGAQAL